MKGDFSKAAALTAANDLGLLYQQGRVINDADLTAGEIIAETWRETAARDIIGAHVAAVPAESPDGYLVQAAAVHANHVDVRLAPGRIWADGIHLNLPGTSPVTFGASYLDAPANPAGTSVADIGDGIRDAIVLQVELGALNGFQDPTRLIEPALGGPDTAERIHPHQSLHLVRLGPNEDCTTIGPRIRDNLDTHGRLSVILEPASVVAGDCPVVEGGGYSGFEHNLYRIEIAQTNGPQPMFKWSSLNGGLVGRGRLIVDGFGTRIQISANRGAIIHAGFDTYYLETLVFDDHLGRWQVNYGTTAQLNAAQDAITLDAPPTFGNAPNDGDRVFFRLWNGIERITDFDGGPTPLRDGIELDFISPGGDYVAEDYWTFDLRAGEITNPDTLHNNAAPMGPIRRRVPLAEVTWTNDRDTDVSGEIEDCRRRFRPLSNQKICCTYLVGNGVTTFGDFNSLEEAASHLPQQGGKLCLLPGIHFANLTLLQRRNIIIEGCRRRTMLLPRLTSFAQPIIRVTGGSQIEIANLDFFAPFGIAIDAAGANDDALEGLRVNGCRILSLTYGMRLEYLHQGKITDNDVWLLDHIAAMSAISLRGTDSRVEKNTLGVWPFEFKPPIPGDDDDDTPPDPADPCIEPDDLYGNITLVVGYVLNAWLTILTLAPTQPYRARGGLHLRGGCERVLAVRNRIDGGAGHGITLGGAYPAEVAGAQAVASAAAPAGAAPLDSTAESAAATFVTINEDEKGLTGFARDESGAPVNGLVITLTPQGSTEAKSALSAAPQGRFGVATDPGGHEVTVSAGYEIVSLDRSQRRVVLIVRQATAEVRPDAAFLYQIRLIDNVVERMALSGIGFLFHSLRPIPPLLPTATTAAAFAEFISDVASPRELIGTTNLVRDLVIRGNRLQDNLRVIFTDTLRALASVVGMGGISLPIVEGLRIEGNHIVRNGLSASTPSNGVFVGYCEDAIIAGNHIAGNGPLDDTYDSNAISGLRSGIMIRMASAIVAGGQADAQQKAAVDIRDNHIDQPAGRALTVLAYGPVTCVGNHFNSEREGRGTFLDRFIGVALILNLGGLHRHFNTQGFAQFVAAADGGGFTPDAITGDLAGLTEVEAAAAATPGLAEYPLQVNPRAEVLMPGGETLINSNRFRMGGDNQALIAQLYATLDDLGYDANQSSVFNPLLHFANLTALGQSVRVSDNRLRERALRTAASAITYSFGFNTSAKRHAMNMTTHNQADHCILAMTNAGVVGKQVLDTPNQVVFDAICPALGEPDSGAQEKYLMASVLLLLAASQGLPGDLVEEKEVAELAVADSYERVGGYQMHMLGIRAAEAKRLEDRYGTADMRAIDARSEMTARVEVAEIMRDQAKITRTVEVETPTKGLVLDGRVLDGNLRAYEGAQVELVDRNGESLKVSAKADAAGYYALTISEGQLKELQKQGDVSLRVTSVDGDVQTIDAKPLLASDQGKVRTNVAFDIKRGVGPTLRREGIVPIGVLVPDTPEDNTPRGPRDAVLPADQPTRRPTEPFVLVDPFMPDPVTPVTPTPVTPEPDEPDVPENPETPDTPDPETKADPVPLRAVTGVGPKLIERLPEMGITSANELAEADPEKLSEALGRRAYALQESAKEAVAKQDSGDNDNKGKRPGGSRKS